MFVGIMNSICCTMLVAKRLRAALTHKGDHNTPLGSAGRGLK